MRFSFVLLLASVVSAASVAMSTDANEVLRSYQVDYNAAMLDLSDQDCCKDENVGVRRSWFVS